jgi:hypothetical protein
MSTTYIVSMLLTKLKSALSLPDIWPTNNIITARFQKNTSFINILLLYVNKQEFIELN